MSDGQTLKLPKITCNCGRPIARYYSTYLDIKARGDSDKQAFEALGIDEYCCRKEMMGPGQIAPRSSAADGYEETARREDKLTKRIKPSTTVLDALYSFKDVSIKTELRPDQPEDTPATSETSALILPGTGLVDLDASTVTDVTQDTANEVTNTTVATSPSIPTTTVPTPTPGSLPISPASVGGISPRMPSLPGVSRTPQRGRSGITLGSMRSATVGQSRISARQSPLSAARSPIAPSRLPGRQSIGGILPSVPRSPVTTSLGPGRSGVVLSSGVSPSVNTAVNNIAVNAAATESAIGVISSISKDTGPQQTIRTVFAR